MSERDVEQARPLARDYRESANWPASDTLFHCCGIGGMAFNASIRAVTESSAGAKLLARDSERPMAVPAACFVAEIRRRIHRYRYACLVGGHVSSQIVDSKSLSQSCFPCSACLDEFLVAHAVQLPMRHAGQLSLGAMIFLRRIDTDELCERFGWQLLTQHGAIVSEAETCRIQRPCTRRWESVYAQSVVWEAEFLLAAGCMIDMDESIWCQSNN